MILLGMGLRFVIVLLGYMGRGVERRFRGRIVNMGEVYRVLGILVL